MEHPGPGKSPNTSLSFRYNANNEELEELYHMCDDDPPTPQNDSSSEQNENASPRKADKGSSIIDKYFKSIRTEKEKVDEPKSEPKLTEEPKPPIPPKEVSSSPMKDYLNRLGKRATTSEGSIDAKEGSNETWKIFHDFKFKIAQAVEDIKTRSVEEPRDKSVPRENSTSDSEESSAIKDLDQQSVGDTDNQVSSLHSSIQNLSDITQPITAKPTDGESSLPLEKNNSESSDDTHKNLAHSESENGTGDLLDDSNMLEVESGIEALEDTNIDIFAESHLFKDFLDGKNPPILNILPCTLQRPQTPVKLIKEPSQTDIPQAINTKPKKHCIYNVSMYILTSLLIISFFLFPNCSIWNGFVLGVWGLSLFNNVTQWCLDTYFTTDREPTINFTRLKSNVIPYTYSIPNVKEHRPLKKYKGWINHYRFPEYDPFTYHINKTTTAFMKLEGCNLRISYTKTKIAKRALWNEKIEHMLFYQHRLYNLTGAKVCLLPNGLVRKRQWSKKYPICIVLNEDETIQVLEKEFVPTEKKVGDTITESKKKEQESEATETNASPEKKKKFIWRKKDKSISQSDGEVTSREGLRHRLVRKMHRDKKPDNVSTTIELDNHADKLHDEFHEAELEITSASTTSTKEEGPDEDLDEQEIHRLKEFLEQVEPETLEGTAESEWSVHVKQSKDGHSHLYLFARTGRDKLEWFRRIYMAISEANTSQESSVADDKSPSEVVPDSKEVEMAVYKVAEKEMVSFPKTSGSTKSNPVPPDFKALPDIEASERSFWPYLLKIMEAHEVVAKQTVDACVSCDIEPTPTEPRGKTKKKRKCDPKATPPDSVISMLPSEVTWVNTIMARLVYDVMKDPKILLRVQNRIQRKLNTLKLPSFMSPLVVIELSLAGACPLVERVGAPSWDERGVWLDADLRYDGGAYITILTQINLMKLKEKNLTLEEHLTAKEHVVEAESKSSRGGLFSDRLLRRSKPAIFDSEVEDSAESSSDDESPPVQPVDSNEALPTQDATTATPPETSGKKKFLRIVDKISTNKYFQQVTDFKYVKRAMEGLSNTDIKLQVEIQGLEGRLALNFPPPPHDRFWIGFRTNPQLVLKARPAVGARTLRFAHISNWIEHKLSKEFEKVLVLPNMEDISVDFMTPTPVYFE